MIDFEKLKQKTKDFWINQFAPWEESGFTKSMINESIAFYHSKEFYEKSKGENMVLITIIDKQIFWKFKSYETDPEK